MLHILLLILKIIGITLLVILGLVILVVCTLLFAPVRYLIKAETDHGFKELTVQAKATWILRLMTAKFAYNKGETNWQVRILWKKLNEEQSDNAEQKGSVKKADRTEQSSSVEGPDGTEQTDSVKTTERTESAEKVENDEQNWFEKLKCTIKKICDKIKKLWETKEKITEFLTDESHVSSFMVLKDEVFKLAKHLHPRKIKGYVHFGLDDPYKTGQVLAVLSVLYPFYGEHVQIVPEFEHEILEGNLYMRGHIRLLHILVPVCKLYFDNNVRKTYKDYKALKW